MKPFADHRPIYDLYCKCGEIVNFYHGIQKQLLEIYKQHADPNYHYNNRCGVCVAEFLHTAYTWYLKQIGEK